MRYLELFAGAGGLSMGLEAAGMVPVAHAEIEPHACAVLRHHWPDTELLGDVSTVDGTAFRGRVDVVAGGSPCQDLSVAGKRAGLDGARSGLFHQQARIWAESAAPYLIWENVVGALSSQKGHDFAVVLSTLIGRDLVADGSVRPDTHGKIKWKRAGRAVGPTGVAAWRVLDLQYFGPPQHRRRVFVVAARAGGSDPAEVLALREGVCGHPSPRERARQGAAAGVGAGAGVGDAVSINNDSRAAWDACAPALRGGARAQSAVLSFKPSHYTRGKDGAPSDVWPPLSADADKGDVSPAIGRPTDGMGVVVGRMVAFGEYKVDGTASAIKARDYKDATDIVIHAATVPAEDATSEELRVMPSADDAEEIQQCAGVQPGIQSEKILRPSMSGEGAGSKAEEGEAVMDDGSLPRAKDVSAGAVFGVREGGEDGRSSHQLGLAGQQRGEPDSAVPVMPHKGASFVGRPRRLLPIETERLMGWPDRWSAEGLREDGTRYALSDSARYKLCGNGVGAPVAAWIGRQLMAHHAALG